MKRNVVDAKNVKALELFETHEWVVKTAVKGFKFADSILDYEDAYQIASMELWRCAKNFDADKGIKFGTYATTCVTGTLQNRDREFTPNGFKMRSKKVFQQRKLMTDLRNGKDLETALRDNDCSRGEYYEVRDILSTSIELDNPVIGKDLGDMSLHEVLASDFNVEDNVFGDDCASLFKSILGVLNETEKVVLKLKMNGANDKDIASELGITYSGAKKSISSARKKIVNNVKGIPSKYKANSKERKNKFIKEVLYLHNDRGLKIGEIARLTGQTSASIGNIIYKNKKMLANAI